MAISIKCSCGKTLRIDEKHLGKRVKCPVCGTPVLVQEASAETAVQADKPKKKAPAPVTEVSEKPRKPASARRPVEDDDNDEPDEDQEEDEQPRKSKKRKGGKPAKGGSSKIILAGAGIFALLLLCLGSAGVGYYFLKPAPAGPAGGPGPGNVAAGANDLSLIHDGAVGFASVRVADVWKNQALQDQIKKMPEKAEMDKAIAEMETNYGVRPDNLERYTVVFHSLDGGEFKQPEIGMAFKSVNPVNRQQLLDAIQKNKNLKERKTDVDGITVHILEGGPDAVAIHFASDSVMFASEKEKTLREMLKQSKNAAKHPALTRGIELATSAKHQLVAAVAVNKNILDKVPADAWKQAPNLREMTGAIGAGTLANDLALEFILTFPDADKADKGKKDVDAIKNMATVALNTLGKAPPSVSKMLQSIQIAHRESEVVINARVDVDLGALGKMLPIGGGGPSIQSINNLKNIALSVHGFHDANKRFPKGAESVNPKAPGLSWRVAILPWMEEYALYKQIRHDEPFDSAHNKQFWNKMPKAYLLPGKVNDGKTYYQVFRGNESYFPNDRSVNVPITSGFDGSSNTILVIEAATPVNWMAPIDLPFNSKQTGTMSRVGNHWGNNTFNAAMGDGTVRTFRRDMPDQILNALITRSGGEAVDFMKWSK